MDKQFKCPLCESLLSESRYYEIVGVWEAKKKFEDELKKKIEIVKLQQQKLLKEKEDIKKKFEIEKKNAIDRAKQQAKLEEKKLAQKELIAIKKANLDVLQQQKKEFLELRKKDLEAGKLKEKEFLALKKEKEDIIKQKKKELLEAKNQAREEGKQKEKKRADMLSVMLQRKMGDIEEKTRIIKDIGLIRF